ncbi:MAG: 5-methylthioadenosine/S-adenosylhomocysteine deaminase [Gemmatimonadaceae bacterium]|nr:5-methylthioadenosine/S-adenosylhomocysteine deaminase [Gemmatimonadaceae bacterium]
MISYHARWVLPVSSPPIHDGCVTVSHGRIVYVGSMSSAPTVEMRTFGNAVLMPGLVNTHTHLELTAMRGFLEDLAFRPWVLRLTKARSEVLTPQMMLASAIVAIAEGLQAGITTFAETTSSGVGHEALRTTGARGIVYQEVFGPHPDQVSDAMTGLTRHVAELRRADTPRVKTGVSPHAPYSVSDALFSAVADYTRAEELPVAVHIAESEAEVQLVKSGDGQFASAWRAREIPVDARAASPVTLLDKTGVLRTRPLLIHCVRVGGVDMTRMMDSGCGIAHCPASNAKLGHGIAPLHEMLQLGLQVGLGTDSVASNNRMDLLDEARLAVLLQRARLGSPDVLGSSRAIELATLGGARAIGLGREIGSLEVGKAADLAVFSLEGVRAVPAYDPAGALVYSVAGRAAKAVFVEGMELVREGQVRFDVEPMRRQVQDAGQALAKWLASATTS